MSKLKDYYALLGVSRNADISTITQAYYRAVKKYHPEINPKAANLFHEISDAYSVLSSPEVKANYDRALFSEEKYNKQAYKRQLQADTGTYEESGSPLDDWMSNDRYYADPNKDSIFKIIDNMSDYRWENAVSSIWHRNFTSQFGAGLLYFLAMFSVLYNIFYCLLPKSVSQNHKYKWTARLATIIHEHKFWKCFYYAIILVSMSILKLCYNLFMAFVWIFNKLIKPLLIPAVWLFTVLLKLFVYIFIPGAAKHVHVYHR